MTSFPFTLGPGKFRVLLAVLVVFSHLSFVEIGRPAVFVFFMLSGYWVLRMGSVETEPSWLGAPAAQNSSHFKLKPEMVFSADAP